MSALCKQIWLWGVADRSMFFEGFELVKSIYLDYLLSTEISRRS